MMNMTSSQVHPPWPVLGQTPSTRKNKVLTWLEPYLPVLPLLFLGYLFLAADFLPSTTADQFGLLWQECRLAGETYQDTPNEQQVEKCFGGSGSSSLSVERLMAAQDTPHPPLVRIASPYELEGRLVSIGKMGIKYFLLVDGKKVGPTFDAILLDSSAEGKGFSVTYGQGRYVFRGVRGGIYYLVAISGFASTQ